MKIYGLRSFLIVILFLVFILILFWGYEDIELILICVCVCYILINLKLIVLTKQKIKVFGFFYFFYRRKELFLKDLSKVLISDGGLGEAITTIRFFNQEPYEVKSVFMTMYPFERRMFAKKLSELGIEVDGNGI